LGFWFLEIVFLKLKTSHWPISSAGLILFLVHWATSWLIANANHWLEQKKYWFFALLFLLSLLIHFAYNQLLLKSLS